eukprot:GILK01008121.1.p1 GENE.GILK01008121.1~~GILK01008121.1.p1  ORF type:complete len:713 (-),score=122.65 GILK01008121.1:68-2164(-)
MSSAERFSALNPVRDLAANFNIDVARQLEEYLEELEQINVSVKGAGILNFAEAALLIQASACVWSKKVEYVYALVYKALDLILDKKKNDRTETAADASRDPESMFSSEVDQFLELDDVLVEGQKINLDDSLTDEDSLTQWRSKHALLRTPLALMPNKQDIASESSSSFKRSEFKTSSCTIHESGAILLEERSPTLTDRYLEMLLNHGMSSLRPTTRSVLVPATTTGDYQTHTDHQSVMQDGEGPMVEAYVGAIDDDDDDHDDGGVSYPMDAFQDVAEGVLQQDVHSLETSTMQAVPSANNHVDMSAEEEVDPWAPLDPHDSGTTVLRPLKKGRTFRVPSTVSNTGLTVIANADKVRKPSSVKAPLNSDFAQLQRSIMKSRKAAAFQVRRSVGLRMVPAQIMETTEDAEDSDDDGMMFAPEWPLLEENVPAEQMNEAVVSDDMMNMASLSEAFDMPDDAHWADSQTQNDLQARIADSHQTYEDLCRAHIEAFIASASEYTQITGLSRRVSEWENKLEPLLQEQENHPPFDIQNYGRHILHNISEEVESSGDVAEEIDFMKVVQGAEKWDVCRMFLATLQLANNGNVEICSHEDRSFDMSVRLISTTEVYQLEDYRAPSLNDVNDGSTETPADANAAEANTTRKKRKAPKQHVNESPLPLKGKSKAAAASKAGESPVAPPRKVLSNRNTKRVKTTIEASS